jgi:hypothetical protein
VSEKVYQWVESEAISELGAERTKPTRELRFGGLTKLVTHKQQRGSLHFARLRLAKRGICAVDLGLV